VPPRQALTGESLDEEDKAYNHDDEHAEMQIVGGSFVPSAPYDPMSAFSPSFSSVMQRRLPRNDQ
jgi:hypothetical protein